jgi:hypothetical protein
MKKQLDLKEAVNRLYERSISLDIDDKLIKMRWVQRINLQTIRALLLLDFLRIYAVYI